MAVKRINIETFISLSETILVVDVRSPSEYEHAHFPGAISVPLFADEERKQVGITYKQENREAAIKLGLDFFGPKMKIILNRVEEALAQRDAQSVLVHCWRGGMRSAAVAWLLDLYGFEVYTLEGGYKRFRNWVLTKLATPHKLRILSGFTGSGKTEILHELQRNGAAVIDLEGLASHKGSAFGNLERLPQGSNELFENKLAMELYALEKGEFGNACIWLESESSRIGHVNIHQDFFNQMKAAPRLNIEVPFEARLAYIVAAYGCYDTEVLEAAVLRIKKRLGGLATKNVLSFLEAGAVKSAFAILLSYYDRFYAKSTLFQPAFAEISLNDTDAAENAKTILERIKKENAGNEI